MLDAFQVVKKVDIGDYLDKVFGHEKREQEDDKSDLDIKEKILIEE